MVIDADGHVTETSKQIEKYLDEPFRSRSKAYQENALFPRDGADRRHEDRQRVRLRDPALRALRTVRRARDRWLMRRRRRVDLHVG